MNNEDGGQQNAEPGWVFHPETGKMEKPTPTIDTPAAQNIQQPAPAVQAQMTTPTPAPTSAMQTPTTSTDGSVSWTASEFIDHSKNFSWYALLLVGTIVLSGAIYLITKDIFSVIVIVFFAGVFGFVASRKPKVLDYIVSEGGINIGAKGYPYKLFKSFSVMEEIAIDSIVLSPLKRFMPPITIYFPPEEMNEIIDILTKYLPHEEKNHDSVEKLMQKIRF